MVGLEETTFGPYVLKRRLARGGMSVVYLAYDQQQERDVAIKVVNKEQSEHAERFQREINALSVLEHEHILPTLDYGEQEQWLYLVMPYIEHGTLRDLLRAKGRLTLEEADVILAQVCDALQFAHDHGAIHRDIKPSNILLSQGQHVYLADFGLVKEMNELSDLTQTGCLVGTPEYMAPELAEEPAGISSDIYAVGVLLYQMLTGQVPFKGPTAMAIYWKHIQESPVRPSLINPGISQAVEQVVLCALEKDPALRFRNVHALSRAYTQALLAPAEHPQLRATAPLAPLVSIVPVGAGISKTPTSIDMRGVASSRASNLVGIPASRAPRRVPLSHKVLASVLGVVMLIALPFSFGYSLYNNVSDTYTALGTSAHFTASSSRPTVQTNNRTSLKHLTQPKSTPRPILVTSFYHPPISPGKHGHKHGHKHGDD